MSGFAALESFNSGPCQVNGFIIINQLILISGDNKIEFELGRDPGHALNLRSSQELVLRLAPCAINGKGELLGMHGILLFKR